MNLKQHGIILLLNITKEGNMIYLRDRISNNRFLILSYSKKFWIIYIDYELVNWSLDLHNMLEEYNKLLYQ
jgi:hypothetical protein